MNHSVEFDERNNICTVRITGEFLRPDDSISLKLLLLNLGTEKGYRLFLVDMTQADVQGDWKDAIPALDRKDDSGHEVGRLRFAFVYPGDLAENKLLETTAGLKGYVMSAFDDIGQAADWLTA